MNPQNNHEDLKKLLVSLLATTHRTISETFNEERRTLLEDNLFQKPYIEAIPMYQHAEGHNRVADLDAHDLPGMSPAAVSAFKALLKDKISYTLYSHQKEMLQKAVNEKKPCVVTTGTSSGKTESFLMPLLAGILNEAVEWPHAQWHEQQGKWECTVEKLRGRRQRIWGEKREAAVRAVVLYPMNALVDDQLSRLRDILDSDEAHQFYGNSLGGNRITFCRYTGNTIGRGHLYSFSDKDGQFSRNDKAINRANQSLKQMRDADKAIINGIARAQQEQNEEERTRKLKKLRELRNFFPRTDPESAEMLCRWEIQQHPADILITNYSMLSAMLMRGKAINKPANDPDNTSDGDIFEKTKAWLAGETDKAHPTRIFTIVVDELHLYRGTAGTEVAYLLRLLLARLGLTPDSPQFRILASSASLAGEEAFNPHDYLKKFFGKEADYEIINGTIEPTTGNEPFSDEDKGHLTREVVEAHAGFIRTQLQVPSEVGRFRENLGLDEAQFSQLLSLMDESNSEQLPRCRLHWIVRNSPGIFACVAKPTPADPFRTVGPLHFDNSALRENNGGRIFEVLFCEACGTLFVAGYKSNTGNPEAPYALVGQSPNLDVLPNGYVDTRITEERERQVGLFWPEPHGVDPHAIKRELKEQGNGSARVWHVAYLDPVTGVIHDEMPNPDEHWVKGYIYRSDMNPGDDARAMSPLCPHCGCEKRPGSFLYSPIRQIRIGHDRYVQAIVKKLFSQLPENPDERKLLAFSDSREDAAKLADGIQRAHWRDVLRAIIFNDGNAESPVNTILKELCDKLQKQGPITVDGLRTAICQNYMPYVASGEISLGDDSLGTFINRYNNHSSDIVLNTNFIQSCANRMDRIGVFPFGPELSDQLYYQTWWTDYSYYGYGPLKDLRGFATTRHFRTLREEVSKVIFSQTQTMLDAESIGMGHVVVEGIEQNDVPAALRQRADAVVLMRQFCEGLIRILGESFGRIQYYDGQQMAPDDYWTVDQIFNARTQKAKLRIRDYARAWAQRYAANEDAASELLASAVAILSARNLMDRFVLKMENLKFHQSNDADEYFICSKCRRIHLHASGGICTSCYGTVNLVQNKNVGSLRKENYYARLASDKAFRLHSEELTGQTNDQTMRQRFFRDLFNVNMNGECVDVAEVDPVERRAVPIYDSIDLLSVTTTMEVGVDIGSLSTVFMGNVPPERYNYQQRVGRAGRKGQRFSLAVMYSRGGSFSNAAFENPERMISSAPKMPFLCMSQDHIEIARRVAAKEILRRYMRDRGFDWTSWGRGYSDIHGEFGMRDDARNGVMFDREGVQAFIQGFVQDNTVFLSTLASGTDFTPEQLAEEIEHRLTDGIVNATENNVISTILTAQRLAEAGVLPMFGMPSTTRNIYYRVDQDADRVHAGIAQDYSVERDFEQALSCFAPGCVVSKDHRSYWACGLVGPFTLTYNNQGQRVWQNSPATLSEKTMAICPRCQRVNVFSDGEEHVCKACHESIADGDVVNGLEPAGYMTDWIPTHKAPEGDEIALTGRGVQTVDTSDGLEQWIDEKGIPLRHGFLPSGQIYTVNNRNGAFFNLTKCFLPELPTIQHTSPLVPQCGNERVYVDRARYDIGLDAYRRQLDHDNGYQNKTGEWPTNLGDRRYMLYTVRTTNSLRLDFSGLCRAGLTLNPLSSTAIRAAYYSLATMIVQKVAEELDISPTEIDIVNIGGPVGDDHQPIASQGGYIILADHLVNGSGYVAWLHESGRLESILRKIDEERLTRHPYCTCSTSCEKCLRTYQNQPIHPLLDWELGLDIVRLILEPDYDCLLTDVGNWNQRTGENNQWLEAFSLLDPTAAANAVVAHPFWSNVTIPGSVLSHHEGKTILDTFNLKRRPAWLLQHLVHNADGWTLPKVVIGVVNAGLGHVAAAAAHVVEIHDGAKMGADAYTSGLHGVATSVDDDASAQFLESIVDNHELFAGKEIPLKDLQFTIDNITYDVDLVWPASGVAAFSAEHEEAAKALRDTDTSWTVVYLPDPGMTVQEFAALIKENA